MDTLMGLIGPYYGLDWVTMLIGSIASFAFSGFHLRTGFILGIIACCFGLTVAVMSQQWGFVAYNMVLISSNVRGLVTGDRRSKRRAENKNFSQDNAMRFMPPSEAVPVRVRAR